MKTKIFIVTLLAIIVLVACAPTSTPEPFNTPIYTEQPTKTFTPEPTVTVTAQPTKTFTPEPTVTVTAKAPTKTPTYVQLQHLFDESCDSTIVVHANGSFNGPEPYTQEVFNACYASGGDFDESNPQKSIAGHSDWGRPQGCESITVYAPVSGTVQFHEIDDGNYKIEILLPEGTALKVNATTNPQIAQYTTDVVAGFQNPRYMVRMAHINFDESLLNANAQHQVEAGTPLGVLSNPNFENGFIHFSIGIADEKGVRTNPLYPNWEVSRYEFSPDVFAWSYGIDFTCAYPDRGCKPTMRNYAPSCPTDTLPPLP